MTTSGADEPHILLSLLWRHQLPPEAGKRGPKQMLSVDEVVSAAVALADQGGYDKVSVRAVAGALGVPPMSLYTYVPSKEALTVLMVDAVAAEDEPIDAGLLPRERLAMIARQVRDELFAHPWLLEVSPWRLVLGPGRMRRYERHLAAVAGLGFTEVEMDRAIAVLSEFAVGNARMALAAVSSAEHMTDAQWWQVYGPLLTEAMPAADFPLASRVGAAVGELYQAPGDPDGDFEYGLGRLLDGMLFRT